MDFKKIWLKIRDRKKYLEYKNNKIQERGKKLYESKIKNFLTKVDDCLTKKDEISFLHSGTLGDIINGNVDVNNTFTGNDSLQAGMQFTKSMTPREYLTFQLSTNKFDHKRETANRVLDIIAQL